LCRRRRRLPGRLRPRRTRYPGPGRRAGAERRTAMSMPASARRKGWTRKQKRLALIAGLALVLALATALVLTALRDQIVFFYSPTDVAARQVEPGTPIRLGGLVKEASWTRHGEENLFAITDGNTDIVA